MESERPTRRLLRADEAAVLLNVKESTVRAWLLKRKLPRVRIGARAVRIPLEAIERLIAEGMIPAREGRSGR